MLKAVLQALSALTGLGGESDKARGTELPPALKPRQLGLGQANHRFLALLEMHPPGGEAYCDFREEVNQAEEQFEADHPLGLSQAEIGFSLEAPADIFAVCAAKLAPSLKLRDGQDAVQFLKAHSHNMSLPELVAHLSFAEVCRLKDAQTVGGRLGDYMQQHPLYNFVNQIVLSAWHWYTSVPDPAKRGMTRLAWQSVQNFHRLFASFDFGQPGLDVTLDHTGRWTRMRGRGMYTNTFIDGEFAFIISAGGKQVMTIGVCPTNVGLLVNQIQLKHKKGNRWLYKLPTPYFQYVLQRLWQACNGLGMDVYLVDEHSLHDLIKRSYDDDDGPPFDPQAGEHILRTYSQPLGELRRSRKNLSVEGLRYRQLVPSKRSRSVGAKPLACLVS